MIEEWGTSKPFKIANVTMHDSSGKEVVIPRCPTCEYSMSALIGKQAFTYICTLCPYQEEKNETSSCEKTKKDLEENKA